MMDLYFVYSVLGVSAYGSLLLFGLGIIWTEV